MILKQKKQSGFSLIELLVVMAIIAALATTAVVRYSGYMSDARATTAKQNLSAVASAKDLYFYNPARTAAEQTTFNTAGTTNATRFASISQYLSISGSTPATTAAIAAGTSGTDCIIGDISTAPLIQ